MPDTSVLPPPSSSTSGLLDDFPRFLGVLRRGWRVVALWSVACLAVAVIYLVLAPREYQAEAQLLILQQGGHPLALANPDPTRPVDGSEDYIQTHAAILCSTVVVQRAIDSVGIENLPTLRKLGQHGPNPAEEVIKNYLKVTRPDRQAKVLVIEYRARSGDEAVRLVQALTASYRTFLEDTYQRHGEVLGLITRARQEVGRQLEEEEKRYLEFRQHNPIPLADEKGRPFVTSRFERWDRATNEAMIREAQLKAQLELGRKLSKEGTGLWAIVYAMNQVGGDPNNALLTYSTNVSQITSSDYARQLSQEQQALADRYGPQYAKVQEIQEQLTRIQERARASRSRYEQAEVTDLLTSLEQSVRVIETMRAGLNKGLEQDKKLEAALVEDSNRRSALERGRALYNAVVDQLKQAQLSSEFSTMIVQTLQPASALPDPVRPRQALVILAAVLVGLAVGVMHLLVKEQLHGRIRSAEEVRHSLGLAVLGQLPRLSRRQRVQSRAVPLFSHTLPNSALAEACKVLRTHLELFRQHRNVQVLLVTSPHSHEGKTTTASNLAISLASAGQRVLLIDGDLRHPSLDRLYDLTRDEGLTGVLRGQQTVAEVVQRSAIENLHLVSAGPSVGNPAELLMSARLKWFLDEVRSRYDMVILDSSPVLNVTDPVLLGTVADGMLLVVRDGVTGRKDADRAMELLRALQTPLLGAVLNGTERLRHESYAALAGMPCGFVQTAAHPVSPPASGELALGPSR